MHRKITRRDFINGAAVTAGAAMMPWHLFAADDQAPEKSPNYYPPALTGMRGDRQSTRLNSSHSQSSYAVFCLKKKKRETKQRSLSLHSSRTALVRLRAVTAWRCFFFFNATATTEIYTLSLHDALPI